MRTIETTVYTFDELSDSAKQKALDYNRYRDAQHDWWEWTYEDFISQVALKGYAVQTKDIHHSGFCSQGDGACFAGSVRKTSEETLALLPCDLAAKIQLHHAKCRLLNIDPINLELTARLIHDNSNYCHSNTMEIVQTAIEGENWRALTPIWPDVCDERDELIRKVGLVNFDHILREEAKGLADELYKSLEQEHEYLTSDEHIAEYIRGEEIEFTEDGGRV